MTKLGQKIIKFTKTYTTTVNMYGHIIDDDEYAIRRLEEDGKIQRSPGRARNLFVIS